MGRFLLVIYILWVALPALAGPSPSRPSSRPAATTRALTPEQQRRLQVLQLSRKALELFKQKKLEQAEALLMEALALEPDHTTSIYNMACSRALRGKPDDAIAYLQRAVEAGFTDFIHIEKDPDLNALRELPAYKRLLASREIYQKRSADLAVESLRRQLGDKYLYEVDPSTKLIFAADTDPQTLADAKKWLSAQSRSLWSQLFSHRSEQYTAIVLPSMNNAKDLLRRIGLPRGTEGVYLHDSRLLIASRLGQVMTHEFTHALHAADLETDEQEHAIWIVEGIASLFEPAQFEGDKLVPRDNYRLWHVQGAYRARKLFNLEKLLTMKQPQFVASANLAYGVASSVMLYLYEHNLLKTFYESYKISFAKDPTGRVALEQATGRPLAQFEKDWQAWMIRRVPPAMNTGPDGAYLGVRFAQENDGLKIDEVVKDGPAYRAGIKLADVVVGLNDYDVRDQQSLMPMLKEFKPGEPVKLRIRRGEQYLTVALTLGRRDGKIAVAAPPPATPGATAPAK